LSFLLESLQLKNFRNYRQLSLEFDPSLTILIGRNGIGKTNIIEALQLLTEGKSFRTTATKECIYHGEVRAQAELRAVEHARIREVILCLENNKRLYSVNEKKLQSVRNLYGVIPCVIFTPDDLCLVKNPAQRRREEIDSLGIQLSATYARLRSEYTKIITQRNRLLKSDIFHGDVFEAWTERLVEIGVALYEKRRALFERLRPFFLSAYQNIDAKNELRMHYSSSWLPGYLKEAPTDSLRESFLSALEQNREEEVSRRLSVTGPHRDDLVFDLNNTPARNYASQGQQRSIALAWKLAEIQVIEEITGLCPLLLLDDVMSELDKERRRQLTALVGMVAQTVITTTHSDYFEKTLQKRASIIDMAKV
jgi:DNA replication and repair protein RecF